MATIKVKPAPEAGNEFVPYRNVPNVRFPNTLAPIGRALKSLGAAFGRAQAAGMAAEETKWDMEFLKRQADLEHAYAETLRQAPADGKQFSANIGNQFEQIVNEFMAGVPDHLKGKYGKMFLRLQIRLEGRAYKDEVKLHDQSVLRNADQMLLTEENRALAEPNNAASIKQEILKQFDQLPLPASERARLKEIAKKRIDTAAMTSAAKGTYADIWLNRLHKIEGTGKNLKSSAVGHFQFIDDTWLKVVAKYAPKIYQAYDQDTILGMRRNYAFARQMARAYLHEIATYFMRRGIPVNGTNIRLGWFLGPGGTASFLAKPADMPLTKALPAKVLRANKFLLKYKTVGGMIKWAERQMAGAKDDPYPNVPIDTKVALLSQQNTMWENQAVTDANYIGTQFADTFNTVVRSVDSFPLDKQISMLGTLLKNDNLNEVVAEKVKVYVEKLKKRYWNETLRNDVVDILRGKAGDKLLERRIDQGAPLSYINKVRTLLKEQSGGKGQNPQVSRWIADVLTGARPAKDVLKEIRNSDLPPEVLEKAYRKVNSLWKQIKANEDQELYNNLFRLARAGGLTQEELDHSGGDLPPDLFKKLKAEINRFERNKKKLKEEERAQVVDNLLKSLYSGSISVEQAMDQATDLGIPVTYKLLKQFNEAYSAFNKQLNAKKGAEVVNKAVNSGRPLNPKTDGKQLNDWYHGSNGPETIRSGGAIEFTKTNLRPLAEKGAIPPDAVTDISGLALSDNKDAFWEGMESISLLAEVNPQVLNNQFGNDVVKEWQAAGILLKYGMDKNTVFERISAIRKARLEGSLKKVNEAADNEIGEVTADDIMELLDLGDGEFDKNIAATQNGAMLISDYKRLFRTFYPYFGNKEQADAAVREMMTRLWGVWDSKHNEPGMLWGHTTRFMLLPPNKVYFHGPDGTYKWLDKELDKVLEKYKEVNGQRVVLVADRKSIEAFMHRQPVTYQAYIVSDNGNIFPVPERFQPGGALQWDKEAIRKKVAEPRAAKERERRKKIEELEKQLGYRPF